jgi:hypothetical protein
VLFLVREASGQRIALMFPFGDNSFGAPVLQHRSQGVK